MVDRNMNRSASLKFLIQKVYLLIESPKNVLQVIKIKWLRTISLLQLPNGTIIQDFGI